MAARDLFVVVVVDTLGEELRTYSTSGQSAGKAARAARAEGGRAERDEGGSFSKAGRVSGGKKGEGVVGVTEEVAARVGELAGAGAEIEVCLRGGVERVGHGLGCGEGDFVDDGAGLDAVLMGGCAC